MTDAALPVAVVVLAHNEERRIAACLRSLPLDDAGFAIHVVVNGSTDGTAAIVEGFAARHPQLTLHNWAEGGKARSWNRIILDHLAPGHPAIVLVDGDAEVAPGSIAALVSALAQHPEANAAAALPLNGRRVEHYRSQMIATHGLFGDLHALRGSFVDRMRAAGIRLPVDLIGDDGLVGALAKTDLDPLAAWREAGVQPVPTAGFLCEPVALASPLSWQMQYRRMISYSVRHFQNQIITDILRDKGPQGLPERLASLYPAYLDRFAPRPSLATAWFDRLALKRMASAAR